MKKIITFGVNTLGLKYSLSDANLVALAFENQDFELVNHNQTRYGFTQTFEQTVENAAHVDVIVLYISGHALLERGKIFLLTGDDSSKITNKLDLNYILEIFAECRASSKLVILDCCHASAAVVDLSLPLDRQYAILTASSKLQKSLELDSISGTVFSRYLVDYFNDKDRCGTGSTTVKDIFEAIKGRIIQRNSSGDSQIPLPHLHGTNIEFTILENSSSEAIYPGLTRTALSAEKAYRDLLLRNCDIISLANLPELDRNSAMRPLELRRLYVPLHAWVDIKVGEQVADDVWDRIENRRLAAVQHNAKLLRVENRSRKSIGECLVESGRLIILGDPGSGKTTLLRWMATAYLLKLKRDSEWEEIPDVKSLPEQDLIPILIRCRDLDSSALAGSLNDILTQMLRKAENNPTITPVLLQLLRDRLTSGAALLMFDGLDEITDSSHRSRFCEQLDRIRIAFPNSPVIITSRIVGYREMGFRFGSAFTHLTLADLDPNEKDDFAVRWCSLTETPERSTFATTDLISDIHSSNRIERMTGNPMLLTTMALVKRKVGKLPSRRADLYSEAVQVLLNWRSDIGEPLDAQEALPQLEYIAYEMCDRGTQRLSRSALLELIDNMRKEYPNNHHVHGRTPEDFLQLLERRTGLIVEAGRERYLGFDELVYEFRHLTFQEFLAARALVDGKYPGHTAGRQVSLQIGPLAGKISELTSEERDENESVNQESWREVLRLAVTLCRDEDVESVLLAIMNSIPGESDATRRSRAILATLSAADEPNVGDSVIKIVFEAFCSCIDERDRNMEVRTGLQMAADAVATTRSAKLLADVLARNFYDLPAESRDYTGDVAALVLSKSWKLTNPSIAAVLDKYVISLSSGDEFETAYAGLGIAGIVAVEELDEIPPELPSFLLGNLKGKGSVVHSVAQALGNLYYSPKAFWFPDSSSISLMKNYIADMNSDPEAVRFMVEILEHYYFDDKTFILSQWLGHPSNDLRDSVVRALAKTEDESGIVHVINALRDSSKEVQLTAIHELAQTKSREALNSLIDLVHNEDFNIRSSTLRAIGKICASDSSAVSLDIYVEGLRDESADVKIASLKALKTAEITGSDPEFLKIVENLLSDSDLQVKDAAINLLAKFKHVVAIDKISGLLDEVNAASTIVSTLNYVSENIVKEALPMVVLLLNHSNLNVKRKAAEVINRIDNEKSLVAIFEYIDSSPLSVILPIIKSLVRYPVDVVNEKISSMLDSPSGAVKVKAIRVVGVLELQEFKQKVFSFKNHTDQAVIRELINLVRDGKWGDHKGWLMELVEGHEGDLRRAAIISLAAQGCTEILPQLEELIKKSELPDFTVFLRSYLQLSGESGKMFVSDLLADKESYRRNGALAVLINETDKLTKTLLSKDGDGVAPYFRPDEPILMRQVWAVSDKLGKPIREVLELYENIAKKYRLKITW